MLVSRLFCRSVASYQHIAVVSFAENGRLLGAQLLKLSTFNMIVESFKVQAPYFFDNYLR